MDTDDIWNDLFGRDFDSVTKRMEKMFSDLENLGGTDVKAYGYAMYQDSDGNRCVKEFGNPAGSLSAPHETAGGLLADVSLEDGTVRAVIEIPGVSKENIRLEGTKSTLSISVDSEEKKFNRTLALPCDVDPDSAEAEYNNGILEVTLVPVVSPGQKKQICIR